MEKEVKERPSLSVVKWIMSRPEGKQFLSACLFVISVMAVVITRQEYRFENNVVLWGKERQGLQDKVDNAKQETIDILKSANADAQKMRDSLYTLGMKQREIEKQVIKNKR